VYFKDRFLTTRSIKEFEGKVASEEEKDKEKSYSGQRLSMNKQGTDRLPRTEVMKG